MTKNELLEMISLGENPVIEFLEEGIKPNDLAAEIVAFANHEGGLILLGVSDKGEIK